MDQPNALEPLHQGAQFKLVDWSESVKTVSIWLLRNKEKIGLYFDGELIGNNSKETFIEVLHLTDVRRGCRTDAFNEFLARGFTAEAVKTFEDNSFSVHYGEDLTQSLSLIAGSHAEAEVWTNGFRKIIDETQKALHQTSVNPDFWVRQIFRRTADQLNGGDRFLTRDQCEAALLEFNVVLDKKRLDEVFSSANTDAARYKDQEVLSEDEFLRFFQLISHHPILDSVFNFYADKKLRSKLYISAAKLRNFLEKIQGMKGVTMPYVLELIERYDTNVSKAGLSLDGFRRIMFSEIFDVRIETHRKINQDMTRPITEYWQKSSHNTYVVGGQLTGRSTIEGYRLALLKGFVCVEIDLWDGKDGHPVVTHGNTMVKEVRARDILEDGIKPFAFANDDYPIILSLEDNMSEGPRKRFIQDLHEVFGDTLYRQDITNGKIPSPQDLRGKILIKQKKRQYGDLANVYDACPFPFNAIRKGTPMPTATKVSSLSEHEINRLIRPTILEMLMCNRKSAEVRRERFREYTTRALVRVYPGFHRQMSSNFNPMDAINVGAQLNALNVQTRGYSLALLDGRFRTNGDCGFVLKPRFMLDPSAPRLGPKKLTLTIYSALNLPRDPFQKEPVANPKVVVVIEGDSRDKQSKRTKRVKSNGLNPVWNQTMEFTIRCPELAIVLFSVKHVEKRGPLKLKKKYTLGEFALPLLSMGSGYRHVSLQDRSQCLVPLASLFVKVKITDVN